jgi:hypothetical protein
LRSTASGTVKSSMTCRPRADLSAAASVSDNTPRSSPRSASRQPASSTQTKGKRSQALRAGISSLHPHACMYTQNCAGAGTLLYRNITSHVPPAASARTTEARSANRWSRRRSASRHRTPAGRGRQARLAWQASPIQSPSLVLECQCQWSLGLHKRDRRPLPNLCFTDQHNTRTLCAILESERYAPQASAQFAGEVCLRASLTRAARARSRHVRELVLLQRHQLARHQLQGRRHGRSPRCGCELVVLRALLKRRSCGPQRKTDPLHASCARICWMRQEV